MNKRIIINGARGKMGRLACQHLGAASEFKIVAELGRDDDLRVAIGQHQADIVVDFSNAASVYENTLAIIESNAHAVIGTSGLNMQQIEQLQLLSANKQLGGIIAPNFSIGVIMMMRFAAQAASQFNQCEIIELHHNQKQDYPSGSAMKTAELIAKHRQRKPESRAEHANLEHARGAEHHNVPIHSIRLPGLLAHQKILFGNSGEILSIHHDTTDRACFMPGLLLACRKVTALDKLVYGLDELIT